MKLNTMLVAAAAAMSGSASVLLKRNMPPTNPTRKPTTLEWVSAGMPNSRGMQLPRKTGFKWGPGGWGKRRAA